ncbi:TetR family transcriptional regulator [Streptosporangium sp. LJ11]|uniref:TetR/AcrR family transcriptional regulator n=1 Tax=Streptosporangium sp. LJ11 TaxID=3436927 RepID=UPI003F791EB8
MSRASRADAAKHREEIVAATARLLRERGVGGVSVQDVMSAAGLTHGGFYKHFGSKDELMGIATDSAFGELASLLRQLRQDHSDGAEARSELISSYLSSKHRDSPGTGCANAGIAADAARAGSGSPLRVSYTTGLRNTIELLAELQDPQVADDGTARERAIVCLATMVGAMTLARAAADDPVSDEILQVVQDTLLRRGGAHSR